MLAMIMFMTMGLTDLSVLHVPAYIANEWTQKMVKDLAIEQAQRYGIDKERFLNTLACENAFNAKGQSNHYHNGVRENSWGAAQFWLTKPMTLEDGTLITQEIAEDPAQAIPAMAWHFSEGRATKWSCYNDLYLRK